MAYDQRMQQRPPPVRLGHEQRPPPSQSQQRSYEDQSHQGGYGRDDGYNQAQNHGGYDADDILDSYGGGGQEEMNHGNYDQRGYNDYHEQRSGSRPRDYDGYGDGYNDYGGGPPPRQQGPYPRDPRDRRGPPMRGPPPRGPLPMNRQMGPPNGYPRDPRGPYPPGQGRGPPRGPPMQNGGYGPPRPRDGRPPPQRMGDGRGPMGPYDQGMRNGYGPPPGQHRGGPRPDDAYMAQQMGDMDLNGRSGYDDPRRGGGSGQMRTRSEEGAHYDQQHMNSHGMQSQGYRDDPNQHPVQFQRSQTMPEVVAHPSTASNEGPGGRQVGASQGPGIPAGYQDPIEQRSMTTPADRPSLTLDTPARPSTATGQRAMPIGHRVRPFDVPFHGEQNNPQTPQSAPGGEMPTQFGFGATKKQPVVQQQAQALAAGREAEIEEYMPNFDGNPNGPPQSQSHNDLHMDVAPGTARGSPLKPPKPGFYGNAQASSSQPNLRGPYDSAPNLRPGPNGHGPSPGNQYNDPFGQPPSSQLSSPTTRQFHRPGAPPMSRNESGQSGYSDQSGPPPNGIPGRMDLRTPPVRQQSPASSIGSGMQQNRSMNPDALPAHPAPEKSANPDALPAHPAPVRPGLMQHNQPNKPLPNQMGLGPQTPATRPDRRLSIPVTFEEISRLRGEVRSNPNDNATQLFLAKRLVNAAAIPSICSENGRADARTAAKNRENYIFEAHRTIKKLVSANYSEAMFYLADCYGTGDLGLKVDPKEAFQLYQQAAKLNHPAAAYRTAVCCEMGSELGGGTHKEPQKAVQWYRRAAALGDVPAMYKLGMICLKGLLGANQSVGEALTWLQRAAERADAENPHALHELAQLYETAPAGGNGKVIRDEVYAFQCYEQGAKLGYSRSQTRLGKCYEYGQLGCAIDNRSSIHWYSKAAAQEDSDAELALSGWYLTGSAGILDQSDQEAYLWARKAALKECAKAEYAMGYFSEVGIGCPRSLEDAKRWYGRAAAHRYGKAQERLEELRKGGARAQKGRERISQNRNGRASDECVIM